MKFVVSKKVNNYDGKPLNKTYRDLILTALNGVLVDEITTAELKNSLFQLSKKMVKLNVVDLTEGEVALILDRAGKVLKSPLAYGMLSEFLTAKK